MPVDHLYSNSVIAGERQKRQKFGKMDPRSYGTIPIPPGIYAHTIYSTVYIPVPGMVSISYGIYRKMVCRTYYQMGFKGLSCTVPLYWVVYHHDGCSQFRTVQLNPPGYDGTTQPLEVSRNLYKPVVDTELKFVPSPKFLNSDLSGKLKIVPI